MRKITLYTLGLITAFIFMTGCDKDFDELNTNKLQPTSLEPSYLLNHAVINSSHPAATLPYEIAIVQQLVTPNSGVIAGGNFNQDNRPVTLGNWQRFYREVLKQTTDIKIATAEDASQSNIYNMARIIHSYGAMVLTDTYGDVPYTEAGLGYLEDVLTPQYDTQEQIYMDILSELQEASQALDASKPIETGDVLYGGDVLKWKKFANSLLFRAAMRLSKVDESLAQQYVSAALGAEGGLMESNADNAVIRHDANFINAVSSPLTGSERNNYYLAEPFLNFLKENNDPRLSSIAVRYIGAKNGVDLDNASKGDVRDGLTVSTDPEDQIGFPMGYDNGTISPVVEAKGLASFYDFSQMDRTRMGKNAAPAFLVTYAQTQLLLAEAAIRTWAPGDAAVYFENGIRGHMEQLASYDPGSAVAEADIEEYIAANPLDMANALEEINTQYWVASFLNGPEAFANFRRSGYPDLVPNPYPGTDITGDFIRRLTYPDSEIAVNSTNFQQAVTRQGKDDLETRVWWDKE